MYHMSLFACFCSVLCSTWINEPFLCEERQPKNLFSLNASGRSLTKHYGFVWDCN